MHVFSLVDREKNLKICKKDDGEPQNDVLSFLKKPMLQGLQVLSCLLTVIAYFLRNIYCFFSDRRLKNKYFLSSFRS